LTAETTQQAEQVQTRLLKAALDCFLADEYHKVTIRLIAENAGVNASMIKYYFGNKEGLFEEMIRDTLTPLLEALDNQMVTSAGDFTNFFKLYYRTMIERPEFPKLILKILALNQGPGQRFIQQLLERGRSQGAKNLAALKQAGQVANTVDADIVRMAFVSLAMTPMLLKDIFEQQIDQKMDQDFLDKMAEFNGQLFSAGLLSTAQH